MRKFHCKLGIISSLLTVATLAPFSFAHAQSTDQELAARRQAILERDQFINDEGQIIDQDAVLVTPPRPVRSEVVVAPAGVNGRQPGVFQQVGWRSRYYSRPGYGYYGPPRARYYARYPGYYDPYYSGYGYYGGYYGRPYGGYRYGGYPYGTARVGPMRFYWR